MEGKKNAASRGAERERRERWVAKRDREGEGRGEGCRRVGEIIGGESFLGRRIGNDSDNTRCPGYFPLLFSVFYFVFSFLLFSFGWSPASTVF